MQQLLLKNLPGLYALVFFWLKWVQHLAHSHRAGLVWTPPSGSLSRWHLLQNLSIRQTPLGHGTHDAMLTLFGHRCL